MSTEVPLPAHSLPRPIWLGLALLLLPTTALASPTPPAATPSPAPTPSSVGGVAESANPDGLTHAIGFVGGWHGASGMVYRHYISGHSIQFAFLASVYPDEESFVWTGLSYTKLLTIKRSFGSRGGWGLRAVGGASYRWQREILWDGAWDVKTGTYKNNGRRVVTTHVVLSGAGIGLQMGALDTPGISVSLDVTATSEFRGGEFQRLVPLPSLELLFHW